MATVAPRLDATKEALPLAQCEQAEVRLHVTGAGDPTTERLPLDVMLVLDRSGSMSGTPLADAKTAAKGLVDQLNSSIDLAAVTSFATTATLNRALTSNFANVKSSIDGLSASGNTNIGDGVFVGQTELATNGAAPPTVRVMVVLTDGVANRTHSGSSCASTPTAPDACTVDAINQAAAAKAAGTIVFTIGLNLGDYSAATQTVARNTLIAMASSADKYFESPTSAQLQGIFNSIADTITNIAGSNAVITDILPPDVQYIAGSATPAPTSVSGQTLTWNLGIVSIAQTVDVTFHVTLSPAVTNQLVDVYPDSRVDYTNTQGSAASAAFPETHVTSLLCATATPSVTETPTDSPTPLDTATPTVTDTVPPTSTDTPASTATPTLTATVVVQENPTDTPTATPTFTPSLCGDGNLDPGEECDDGDNIDGDCCSASCRLEPAGSPCDDGLTCTTGDVCDGFGICRGSPSIGDYAILRWATDDPTTKVTTMIGRQVLSRGHVCTDMIRAFRKSRIAGDAVSMLATGTGINLARKSTVQGSATTAGASIAGLNRGAVWGRVDTSGGAAELAACDDARTRAANKYAELTALPPASGLDLGLVKVKAGKSRSIPSTGTLGAGQVVVRLDELKIGRHGTLSLVGDATTTKVIVHIRGKMSLARAASIALQGLSAQQVIYVVEGAVRAGGSARLAGTVLGNDKISVYRINKIDGSLLGRTGIAARSTIIKRQPWIGWCD